MATKLELYQAAARYLGERKLASLSENNELRRSLDDVYVRATGFCLERGMWNFGKRVLMIEKSTDITPEFGFENAFEKPDDWVRSIRIADHEHFDPPLLHMQDEAGVWYADCDPLYVEYVSNNTSYGMDLSRWPETFVDYVALRMAVQVCPNLTSSKADAAELKKDEAKALKVARAADALNQPPQFPPAGTWVTSRGAGKQHRSRWSGTFR